ncbi:MAG: phosphatase family protein [Ilumatobacteraceae bacterium]|nr:phosphatase family protein [Ilumatobacteraceae bacterium]
MPVLIAVLVATLLVGCVIAVAEQTGRVADPTDVHSGAAGLAHEAKRHPRLRAFLVRRRNPNEATGLLLSAALVFIAAATVTVGLVLQMVQHHEGFARWDDAAARWGAAHTTGSAETIVHAITQLGSTPVVIGIGLVVAVVEYRRLPSKAVPLFIAVVDISELLVNNLIKSIVRRDRPSIDRLVHAAGYSFPSGHTAAAAASYAAMALVIGRRRSRRTRALLAAGAAAITVAVASSRVLLGVHWLTDVMAGSAVGWGCFALCSIAFGGRLLQFGKPVADAQDEVAADELAHVAGGGT